ncbi:uncharacterized protein [Coffea arabica]|uniref:Uncharacterized protein n=1 Tax=Coffea arabica TaxID=13443 RepID=A0ABM4UPD8_COFAR
MPYIARNAEIKHAENRVACARLVESSMDGEELEGSMVAGTRELSRYKTCLKKTGLTDTLVPEMQEFLRPHSKVPARSLQGLCQLDDS